MFEGFSTLSVTVLKSLGMFGVHGYVEYSQTTIMKPQQALNFSEVLKNSVHRVTQKNEL